METCMRSIVFVMGVICLICLSNSGSAQGLLGSIFGTSYDKTCESNAKRSLGPSTRGPIGKADVANDLCYTMYEIKDNLSLEHGKYICYGDGKGNFLYGMPFFGAPVRCEDATGKEVSMAMCYQARDHRCHR